MIDTFIKPRPLKMAHFHEIEDKKGDVIDRKVYCSDRCNIWDNPDNYQGWNGCNEIDFGQTCDREGCYVPIAGIEDEPKEVD